MKIEKYIVGTGSVNLVRKQTIFAQGKRQAKTFYKNVYEPFVSFREIVARGPIKA